MDNFLFIHLLIILFRSDVHIVFRGPRSQGFGFITFESEASIDKAIDLLKGYELDGRKLNVERCTPRSERPPLRRERRFSRDNNGRRERKPRGPPSETMIFVSNLPFRMTTEELQTLLNGYNVTNCRVVCRRNGSSRGYGFVEAADHDEQLRIINEFNNCECDNRSLHFRAATSEGPHGEQPDDE